MKKYTIIGILAGLLLGAGLTAQAASVLFPYQGGTGNGTAPSYGQMLVGNASGTYTLTATSSLGISGSAFPFTPQTWGNSTSTTLGFLNGFLSTASSSVSILNLSDYLRITATSTPANPASGNIIYSSTQNGKDIINVLDSVGNNRILFSFLGVQGKNTTGSTINKGQVVFINGATGGFNTFALAQATTTMNHPIGIASESIADNAFGVAQTNGVITGIDTSAFSAGDIVYSSETLGALTATEPAYPLHTTQVGIVRVSGVGNGSIYINVKDTHRDEDGESTNIFRLGDTLTGTKSLVFDGTSDGTLSWNNANFALDAGIIANASSTIGNGLSAGGLTVLGNATTTGNLIVQGNATSTFDGDITMSHPHYLTAHGLRGDASDGLYITANNYTAVANFGVGNSANSVFNGGVNIDGATRLATSMNGLVQAASGALTGITGTAGQFPYYNGTNTLLATSTLFLSTIGNVGIGETAPGSKLSVSGGGSFGSGYDTTAAPTNGLIVEGNVGIGTTSPNTLLTVNGNGALENQGQLRFYGLRANSSAYVSLSASSTQTSNVNWTLPIADGTDGQVLTTNGAGNLYFSSGGAGTVTSVTATWPIISSGGTTPNITWGGLSTSTAAVIGNIPYFTGVNTFGNVATSTLAVGASITSSGTLGYQIGGTASTLSLNMANANAWTALQSFANASSTQFSAASETFYINSAGRVQAKDTTNGWTGVVSPTKSFGLSTGTTTTWTASTTGSAYSPFMTMPFTGTLRQIRCTLDQSFLGVNVQVNGSNATPSYFVASTTVGVIKFTAGNTFSAGQKILANFGTTTTAGTLSASCTLDVTETY